MIVPRYRLIFWAGMVLIPVSLIVAAIPDLTLPASCVVLAFLVLAMLDALLAPGCLAGIEAAFESVQHTEGACPLFRLTKDQEGYLGISIRNTAQRAQRLGVSVALPQALAGASENQSVLLPERTALVRFDWACTPHRRGQFRLGNLYVETASPLGFWDVRRTFSGNAEVRVYPNLIPERNRLAAIFLNRGSLGIHRQRCVGKGRDFEKLREYIPGDSYEDIHWKATARRGHPVTKIYQIERTQEVYLVIDASRLSARQVPIESAMPCSASMNQAPGEKARHESQLDRFIQAGLILGVVAEKQGDLFGLLTFSDRIHNFIRAGSGQAHYNACRNALYTMEPQPVNPDFEEVCTFIRLRLRRRALLVFMTNLDDPVLSESFARNLELLNRRHLILVNMLTPPCVRPLFTESEVHSAVEVYEHLGGHLQWRDLRELRRTLHHRGVTMGLLDNAALTPELVSQYLNVKRRQLL